MLRLSKLSLVPGKRGAVSSLKSCTKSLTWEDGSFHFLPPCAGCKGRLRSQAGSVCTVQKQPGISSVLGGNNMSEQACTALQPPKSWATDGDTVCPPSTICATPWHAYPCHLSNTKGVVSHCNQLLLTSGQPHPPLQQSQTQGYSAREKH